MWRRIQVSVFMAGGLMLLPTVQRWSSVAIAGLWFVWVIGLAICQYHLEKEEKRK